MTLLLIPKFLLLFFSLSVASAHLCPTKCICVRGSVRCLHQELVAIPKAPKDAYTLDLRFNKIYDIAPGVLSHLQSLRSLLMNDNELRAIHSGAFHGLKHLKYLYLYRNKIQHIDSEVFRGMDHLEQLYLHLNELHQIEPVTFSHMPKLERLYLHNNHLHQIPPGSFRELPRLRKLRLDNNPLVCDCSLRWLVKMIAEEATFEVTAVCFDPAELAGTSLSALSEADLYCQQPAIKKEPQDAVVGYGEDAIFSCEASGEPAPNIVWLRDSATIPMDTTRYEVLDNGTLLVHGADETDVGTFECMAKNEAGEVRSRPARMILHNKANETELPVFVILPRNHVVNPDHENISLDCVANGKPKPHIVWYFNGERLLLNERMSFNRNGSLYIRNVTEAEAGNYTCHAENVKGKISASAVVEVLAAPVFLNVPQDITVNVGDTAHFFCTAKGVPMPIISWFKNTMTLPPNDNIILSSNNQNLTIHDVVLDDAGLYHCRAENTIGLTEISAILKIDKVRVIPPHIVVKPEDTDAFKETSVQLPCEVESEPPATLEWRKDGTRVFPDSRRSITLIGSLIINNVSVSDTGRYECFVFNEYGKDVALIFLKVKDRILPGDAYVNIALTEATRDVDQAIARTVDQLFKNKTSKVDIGDLYRMTRFPNAPAREIARAAEIYERTLDKVKEFIQAGLTVTSAEPFNYQNILSLDHLNIIAQLSGCVAHREERDCSDMCFHKKYRNIDGSCNNFAHPTWGASLTGFRRILFPIYENGFSQPPGWNKNVTYNGYHLPSAREVSTSMIKTDEISEDIKITHMTMQWGQWLDHDLDHALPSVSSQTWDGVDCKKTCDYAPPCFPIEVPANDTRITNRRCIDFIRTSAVCGSGVTSVLFGALQPREQINQLTSFIDASQVYGFEKSVAEDLRDLSNDKGLLRVGARFPGRKPLLPTNGINGMDCRRDLEESSRNCFVAGDIRANEQIGLAAFHTIWMREHNRLATELKTLNPFWDGDKVYQEARKILGAMMQFITYEQWLPIILGNKGHQRLGKYSGYDANINPSISNVFATAALRFGHALINPVLHRYDENFETIPQGHLLLRHAFFSPWRLVDEGGVDPLLRGMFTTPAKLKKPNENLNSELTEKLFYNAHAVALDLAAINVQRSRDHGIPPYTKWRQFCNMSEVETFDDLANEISDPTVREKLRNIYGSVHNIDVWVGGILEDQLDDAKVGPLFSCLLIEQFKRLRDGDRLWYENKNTFKPEQLEQIKKTSLARVLCDNGDNIDTISENVFILPELQDGLVSCEDLPTMDLRYWVDCKSCQESNEVEVQRERRSVKYEEDIQNKLKKRFDDIEETQGDLLNTLEFLKKRVEHLEDTCQTVKT